MRIWHEVVYGMKFLLTPVIQAPTLLQNVLFCLFLLTSVVQYVCISTMDFVSAGNVTVCEKVLPRLNKHDDVTE